MSNLELIVSRCKENVDWVSKIKHPTVVYNKSDEQSDKFVNLPNVGGEPHTFFHHIVKNYESLPNYLACVRGNPFDHCKNAIDQINNFDFSVEFRPLGSIIEETVDYESINHQMMSYAARINFELTFPVYMCPGAQHIVSKNTILKRPKSFYEKILDSVSHELYPQAALDIEKTLFQIYKIYLP